MKKLLALSALPALALLTACGGNDITLTNDNNVVLNDAQANYASVNDGEVAANDMGAMPANDMGGESAAMDANATEAYGSNTAAPQ